MVRLNRIYTRTGDAGTTGLVDGSRVGKADPRIAAIGEVDEANSCIGAALCRLEDGPEREKLARIQNELFDLGADLATPGEDFTPGDTALRVTAAQVERLEQEIDRMNEGLAPLASFILPGGTPAAATAVPLNPQALAYLNRLSDHLFVLARLLNGAGGGDVLWQPGATRA